MSSICRRRLREARYLPFLVALHAGTAIALLLLSHHEWIAIIRGWFLWLKGTHTHDGRMAWMLIWATIPAGIVGLLLKHSLAQLFSKPLMAAILLELPKLHTGSHGLIVPALFGGVLAGITAWLSTRFLLRYFRVHNLSRLAAISVLVGILGIVLVH